MLDETSMAITISIPLLVFVRVETSTVCGRAAAIISKLNAKTRKTNNTGYSFTQRDEAPLNPAKLEGKDVPVVVCFINVPNTQRQEQ